MHLSVGVFPENICWHSIMLKFNQCFPCCLTPLGPAKPSRIWSKRRFQRKDRGGVYKSGLSGVRAELPVASQ
jgi:hypothetical protein